MSVGAVAIPVGASMPGPLLPGGAYEFSIQASPGMRLTTANMFGQSDDLFYAPQEGGIALFVGSRPVSGDVTAQLLLWDAGTEINEEPGFGPNQAPRQPRPNTGPAENGVVRPVNDGFVYPPVIEALRITLTPQR